MIRLATVVVLLLMFAVPVVAVEVIRVDPNTPGAQPAKASEGAVSLDTDGRLDILITYEAQCKPVRVILQELSALSGVALYSGYNNADWQVRDRRMNVFAKDIPLRDLMKSISRVMKFKWRISTTADSTTYRLIMDRLYLLEVQNLLKKQDEEYNRWIAERKQVIVDRYASADTLSDAQVKELRQSDPQLYWDIVSGVAKPMSRFLRETPAVQEALLKNGGVWKGSDLAPAQQQALVDLMRGFSQRERIEQQLNPYNEFDPRTQAPDSILMDQVGIRAWSQDGSFGTLQVHIGEMTLDDLVYSGGYSFKDNDLEINQYFGRYDILRMEGDENAIQTLEKTGPVSHDVASAKLDHVVGGEDLIEHPDDSSLLAETEVKATGSKLRDVEQALAQVTGMAVVSDDFSGATSSEGGLPQSKTTIRAFLEGLSKAYCYNWDKHSNVIELRDRKWFQKRSLQVPDEWIDKWKNECRSVGTIDIESLAAISALSNEQFNVNIKEDDVLSKVDFVFSHYEGVKELLELCAGITDSQNVMLFSPDGLDMSSLTMKQRLLLPILDWIEAGFRNFDNKGVTLYGSRTKEGRIYHYAFKLTSQNENYKPLGWTIKTPEYHEPERK